MEEILASIRRIIADDQAAPAAPAGVHPPPQTSAAASLRGTLRERIPFRGEDRDLAAEAGDRQRPFPPPEREAMYLDGPREAMLRPADAESAGGLSGYGQVTAPQYPTPDGLASERTGADPARPAPPAEMPMAGPLGLFELAARDGEAPGVTSREPVSGEGERAAALFSTNTKQSVSSAFNMLAATRLADNSDELMAMARDMIRPLLKTWLDDNLPSLVERLVRAEIERVARGGR